ncbi:hypothetical protein AC1031_009973 [Aphanomyces cochlioides]|nr:hypothetical protein AC1031_009973 [Aphanomyces cochlioides]
MSPLWTLDDEDYLGPNFQPQPGQIHVLVQLPEAALGIPSYKQSNNVAHDITIQESDDKAWLMELKDYQQRGKLIQDNCKEYCDAILSKVEEFYQLPDRMGKSQLAFALQGDRPYFYWPAIHITEGSQGMYLSFLSISNHFNDFVDLDRPKDKDENDILNTLSCMYQDDELWTYGFLRALLEYCSTANLEANGSMIRMIDKTPLHVAKCNLEDVRATIARMKSEKKKVPFFILDEMYTSSSGKNVAAFQRNVFRVCGLVVIIMGSDSEVTDLAVRTTASRTGETRWMAVVPRFPPYQIVVDEPEEETWRRVVQQYPVVEYIVEHSRGWFARKFTQEVLKIVKKKSDIQLKDLLDYAFIAIHRMVLYTKRKFDTEGAQMTAVSYANISTCDEQPAMKIRRLEVGSSAMHSHLANLVDESVSDISMAGNGFYNRSKGNSSRWEAKCCFPPIDQDVLLYLSVLGGHSRSAYVSKYDVHYSTKHVFEKTKRLSETSTAPSNDRKRFETMVAHAIFCSSRRQGVQGMSFDDFIACLAGEFQDEEWEKMPLTLVVEEETECGKEKMTREIAASDLLEGYTSCNLSTGNVIPFLAPPNAEWPEPILQTNDQGCNFGHLECALNRETCNVLVKNKEGTPLILCECKGQEAGIDSGTMNRMIKRISKEWVTWEIVAVFCRKAATSQLNWKYKSTGCVKINCENASVEWIFQPEDRKQLVLVMEIPNCSV